MMNNLIKKENMTSLEILKEINIFRSQEGNRAELQHYDLLKIIRDEFDEEIGQGNISESYYVNSQNKNQPMFILTFSQAKQILVRESKFVRKATIKYIERLEQELNKPLSIEDMIIHQAESMKLVKKEITDFKEEVNNKFEKVITLESGKQLKIRKAVNKKVMERWNYLLMNKMCPTANKNMRYKDRQKGEKEFKQKLFRNLYKNMYQKFGVSSYRDIKAIEFDLAIQFIESWIEDSSVREGE